MAFSTKTLFALALVATGAAVSGAQADPIRFDPSDLPILVDKYMEIRDPAGPVTRPDLDVRLDPRVAIETGPQGGLVKDQAVRIGQ